MARVLIIGSYSLSLVRFRGALIKAIVGANHSVCACGPESEAWITEWLKNAGAEFQAIPISRTGTSPLDDIRAIKALRRTIRDWRPSHILAYTVKPVVYGAIAARFEPKPHFCAMVTGLGSTFLGDSAGKHGTRWIVRMLYRHAMGRADSVLFQNRDDLNDFLSLGLLGEESKAGLIRGSGVDLEEFAPQSLPDVHRGANVYPLR